MRHKLGVVGVIHRVRNGCAVGLVFTGVWGAAAETELAAPVAGPATGVSPSAFTANWTTVPGATGYELDVYTFDGVPPTLVHEGFDAYPAVTPSGWTITNKSSDAVYLSGGESAPSVKLQETGHAVTTAVYPAAVTNFAFWLKGYSASNSTLGVAAHNGSGWNTLETLRVSNTASVVIFPLSAADEYTRFRLAYDKDAGNVGVDDILAAYGNAAKKHTLTNEAVGNVTAHAATNLTPGVYRYVVRATDGEQVSADSNEIAVDTEALPVPPVIAQVAPQTVHVGETLTFELSIAQTEGDPVTATNVSASAGVSGVWELANGVFTYAPPTEDIGQRTFFFTAMDKDGLSAAMAVTVTVRCARVAAVCMTGATGTYTQDFDVLASNGTDNVWDNAAEPLEAWYAYANAIAVTSYRTGTGSGTAGGLHAFGAEPGAGRSLGSLASSGNVYRYGVAFTNMTGQTITNLTVGFTAEQWRVGASAATHTLAFEYGVTNRVLPLDQGVWGRVNALCFKSPLVTNATQSAGAVYVAAAVSAVITRPVPPGAVVQLRWSDADDAGSDHAFGIDNLTVTWAAGEVPGAIRVGRTGGTETFDEMGCIAGAELPFLWRVEVRDDGPRVSGTYADAAGHVMNVNAVANFTTAGSYQFSSGTEGDYAVGGLSAASAAKSVTAYAKFSNAAGVPVRRWTVRYAVEKYRNGLRGCAVRLLASTDGAAWSEVGAPTSFVADADTNGYPSAGCPCMTVAAERQVTFDSPIAQGCVFYLAWQYAATEGDVTADAQALGIDDVQIVPAIAAKNVFLLR